MDQITRRSFQTQTLASLLTWSLLETLCGDRLLADPVKPLAARWLAQLNDLSQQLKGQPLKQEDWQKQVEALLAKVDLADLLQFIDFDRLTKDVRFRERGERSVRPQFPRVEGLPTELVYGQQVFCLEKDRSVVPHGHNKMATAFLILKGDFHGRHYDRLEDDEEHMIIRPTIDRAFGVGEYSTVSDYKDNVHWFTATSPTAFIFNIHVMNLDTGSPTRTGRVYIDPAGEKLSDNRLRVRKVSSAEVTKLYG